MIVDLCVLLLVFVYSGLLKGIQGTCMHIIRMVLGKDPKHDYLNYIAKRQFLLVLYNFFNICDGLTHKFVDICSRLHFAGKS